jgi:hypothetical protein
MLQVFLVGEPLFYIGFSVFVHTRATTYNLIFFHMLLSSAITPSSANKLRLARWGFHDAERALVSESKKYMTLAFYGCDLNHFLRNISDWIQYRCDKRTVFTVVTC